jgi:Xaa-Pro aminopeptidase
MTLIAPTHDPAACEPTAAEIAQIRRDRMARVRNELKARDLAACVLFDPAHIRYAAGSRNMTIYSSRNPARYLFVPAEGACVMFEFGGCAHLNDGLEPVDEVRTGKPISYYFNGDKLEETTHAWADEIDQLVRANGGGDRIALESATPAAAFALDQRGYTVTDAQIPLERARAIKVENEIKMIRSSLRAVEAGMHKLEAALVPGVSENELWSHLWQHIIATNGDFIETRLLSSGPRTNPWFQECGERRIEAGDMVAHDTDVVGRFGYYADFSRTFLCGDGRPTNEQRTLYALAYAQIQHNMALIEPGMGFFDYARKAWEIPAPYVRNRYFALAHGVGMNGEYPYIVHAMDMASGYDGTIEPGMTLCVESYIGHEDGGEGVKLEEQVYVREDGVELLSDYPFDDRLLGRAA